MRLIVLPCDGIGPEIIDASMDVLAAANAKYSLGLTCDYDDVGFTSLEKYGTTIREEVLEREKKSCNHRLNGWNGRPSRTIPGVIR
jgi:3-isopropylmalate dehydrogenase